MIKIGGKKEEKDSFGGKSEKSSSRICRSLLLPAVCDRVAHRETRF